MSTTLNEALDKLLAKPEKSQTGEGNAPVDGRCKAKPDPVPVADVAFYLLYL